MKLIVHIGAGKTGSSSIQATLEKNNKQIMANNSKYLGIMLENCSNIERPEWQFRGGSDLFFVELPRDEVEGQLANVLAEETQRAQKEGIDTLIWSNEWLFASEHSERAIKTLSDIQKSGIDVKIVCYIRRHDKWLNSAYLQWGLKHKTYSGRIQGFKQWRMGRKLNFFPDIEKWEKEFSKNFSLYNYDEISDVSKHFLQLVGMEGLPTTNDNISPPPEQIAAWVVYNNRFEGKVTAARFQGLFNAITHRHLPKYDLPTINKLVPTSTDLEKIVAENADDIEKIDRLLIERGQPPMSFDSSIKEISHPDTWNMDQFTLSLLFSVAEQLMDSRKRLAELEKKLDSILK